VYRALKDTEPDFASTPNAVRRIMSGNRSRDTAPERRVRSQLHRVGLRFRKNCRPIAGLRCEADVVFPSERVAVFVDGCFWHGCPEHGHLPGRNSAYWRAKIERNVERDGRNGRALAEAGWLVVRAWEHEDPAAVASRVQAALSRD
jgi:DNA mismatch endonuclease (patch repair protein)